MGWSRVYVMALLSAACAELAPARAVVPADAAVDAAVIPDVAVPTDAPADGAADGGVVPLPEPWASLAVAWYARAVACDPDRAASPAVAARIEGVPFVPAALRASLDDPRLTPDVENARRCLADLRHETCFDDGRLWGLSPACQRLFRGSLPASAACGPAPSGPFAGDPCAPPLRCESSTPTGCGRCRYHGPCALDVDCPAPQVCRLSRAGDAHRCVEPLAAGEACVGATDAVDPPCGAGLRCDHERGTCLPRVAVGGACGHDDDCVADAVCMGTCRAAGGDGEPCTRPEGLGQPRGNGCAAGLTCFADRRCHPVSDHAGAFCLPGNAATNCGGYESQLGLWCDEATHECRAFDVVEGGSCGGRAYCLHGTTTRNCFERTCVDRGGVGADCRRGCLAGLVCGPDATGRGSACVTPLPPGSACVPGGVPCEGFAPCRDGACASPSMRRSCP